LNFIAIIILVALLVDYGLNLYADWLNLTRLKSNPPPSLSDLYDAETYARSQDYLRITTHFGWIHSSCNLILLIGFWFARGFQFLDGWVRAWHPGPTVAGLLFIGALALFKMLLDLPFSLYATFVIEERFGFNKTSPGTFFMDRIKGLFLTALIGGPLLAGVLFFFESAGAAAWLYCWAVVAVFLLGIQYVAPAWIMPLFNKFSPIEPGELRTAILSYADAIGFPLSNVFVMDGSRRSSKSNAFFAGFGRHRRIVLFDTLIQQTSVRELVAVLAHEMGHFKKHHISLSVLMGILHMGALFFLLSLFISYDGLFDAFFMVHPSIYAGLVFFSLLYTPVELLLGIFIQALSRRNEYAADRFAAETTRDPAALASALKKLAARNLSNLSPHPFYVFLNDSHPPLEKRLEAMTAYPAGGS
jgi:STE24 endopeptidase